MRWRLAARTGTQLEEYVETTRFDHEAKDFADLSSPQATVATSDYAELGDEGVVKNRAMAESQAFNDSLWLAIPICGSTWTLDLETKQSVGKKSICWQIAHRGHFYLSEGRLRRTGWEHAGLMLAITVLSHQGGDFRRISRRSASSWEDERSQRGGCWSPID